VENTTNFGVFVTISEGLTGLLPRSRVRRGDEFQNGETIELMVTAIDKDSHRITLDYTDRTPEEIAEAQRKDESHFRERDRDSRPPRRGGRQRQDEEWRRYANQKVTVVDDNPFRNL
jgi:transcriptional accessory protein Tex/SPT6